MFEGIDTAATISADAAQKLREDGITFVGRYLVPPTMSKALSATEAQRIRSAGLALLPVWETTADRAKYGASAGAQDGKRARQLAEAFGVSDGVTIYFAVDYNAQPVDYPFIEQYMLAAQKALGGRYVAGLYGHERIVEYLGQRGTVKRFWQCVAWSNRFSEYATVRQYAWQGDERAKAVKAKTGVAVDLDATETLSGMWMPTGRQEYADGDGETVIEYTSATPAVPARPWYADAMAWMRENGLYTEDRPNDTVTRAELATVIQRLCTGREVAYDPEYNRASGLLTDE